MTTPLDGEARLGLSVHWNLSFRVAKTSTADKNSGWEPQTIYKPSHKENLLTNQNCLYKTICNSNKSHRLDFACVPHRHYKLIIVSLFTARTNNNSALKIVCTRPFSSTACAQACVSAPELGRCSGTRGKGEWHARGVAPNHEIVPF